jgi:hypothetical protein
MGTKTIKNNRPQVKINDNNSNNDNDDISLLTMLIIVSVQYNCPYKIYLSTVIFL